MNQTTNTKYPTNYRVGPGLTDVHGSHDDVDVDGVDEGRPKPLYPHRINTLQYTSLLPIISSVPTSLREENLSLIHI